MATVLCGDADTGRDAVQDGFAQAIRSRAGFRGEGSLEGWVWRIVLALPRRQQVRVLMRHSKEGRADHLKSRTAWMVFHLMRALGRTR